MSNGRIVNMDMCESVPVCRRECTASKIPPRDKCVSEVRGAAGGAASLHPWVYHQLRLNGRHPSLSLWPAGLALGDVTKAVL